MSTRSRKTRARKQARRTTQPRRQAPTPTTPLRLVLGGPHATPIRTITAQPRTTPAAPPQPPTDQYARLVDEVREHACWAALYAGTIPIPDVPDHVWTGMTNGQAACHLPDDTGRPITLLYTPDGTPTRITAHRLCNAGQRHDQPVTVSYDLIRLRIDTDNCWGHQPLPPAGPRPIPLHQRPQEHPDHGH